MGARDEDSARPRRRVLEWVAMRRVVLALVPMLSLAAAACGGGGTAVPDGSLVDARPDGPADASPCDEPVADTIPMKLGETGLCTDASCQSIAADVSPYEPRWHLWSDGAEKRRWIRLPPCKKIDTTDMDHWVFPPGTKLWKEFTRDGVRVETRLYQKIGADVNDWSKVAYVWNEGQTEAVATPTGADDVLGTQHDVPSRADCAKCHDSVASGDRILGFSALQLDYDAPAGMLDLDGLIEQQLVSAPPAGSASPHFPLPDAGDSPVALDVIGYLHANCGHCHNPNSTVTESMHAAFEVRLDIARLGSLDGTPTYTSLIGKTALAPFGGNTVLVVPGHPEQSVVISRFIDDNPAKRMPPLATEIHDPTALANLRAWITQLGQ